MRGEILDHVLMTTTSPTSFAEIKFENSQRIKREVESFGIAQSAPRPIFNRIPKKTHRTKAALNGLAIGVLLSIGVAAIHLFDNTNVANRPAQSTHVAHLKSATTNFPAVITTDPAMANNNVLPADRSVLPG